MPAYANVPVLRMAGSVKTLGEVSQQQFILGQTVGLNDEEDVWFLARAYYRTLQPDLRIVDLTGRNITMAESAKEFGDKPEHASEFARSLTVKFRLILRRIYGEA